MPKRENRRPIPNPTPLLRWAAHPALALSGGAGIDAEIAFYGLPTRKELSTAAAELLEAFTGGPATAQ